MYIFAMSRLNGLLEITAQHFNKTEVRPPTWSFILQYGISAVWSTLLFIYPVLWIFVVVLLWVLDHPQMRWHSAVESPQTAWSSLDPRRLQAIEALRRQFYSFQTWLCVFTHKVILSHLFLRHYSTAKKFRWSFANLKQAKFFLFI